MKWQRDMHVFGEVKMVKSGVKRVCIQISCYDERSLEVSVWPQVSELFSMCAFLSVVMRATGLLGR